MHPAILLVLLLGVPALAGPLAPSSLRVNNLPVDGGFPITVHPTSPSVKLEWTPRHTDRGSAQVAFHVVLSDASTARVLHDSGVVKSPSPRHVAALSPGSLVAGSRLAVSVSYVDTAGIESPVATTTTTTTTSPVVVGPTDAVWNSTQWIGVNAGMFRKQVTVTAEQLASGASMTAFVAGIGYHQLYVNGKRVVSVAGETLAGSWTTYNARVLYNAYDVSSALTAGDNVIGVLLGHGWRATESFPPHFDANAACDKYQRLLRVAVMDGAGSLVAGSDTTWSASSGGPIVGDSVYNGESYNAQMEEPGWAATGYKPKSASWSPATSPSCFAPVMTPMTMPPIAATKTNAAVSVKRLDADTQVVDFGENLSGWTRITVKGAAGTTITLRHAEVLMHPPYGPVNGSVYTGNLRSAKATDTYVLKGDPAGETFEPHFTYHGFQYVQVHGYPGDLAPADVTQVHFRTVNKATTNMTSSSDIINRIQVAAVNGQASNQMSVPTDCDQRDERLGWMGDADLSADSLAINFDYAAFQDNYLQVMTDDQTTDGALPDTAPFMRYGHEPADPSWSAAFPQNLYVRSKADPAIVKQYWSALMLYFSNIAAQVKTSGGLQKFQYGDWVPAQPSIKISNSVPAAYNYIVNVAQAIEMGTAVGEDVNALTKLHSQLQTDFNSAFMTSGSDHEACWSMCSQAGWAMAHQAGVISASNMTAVTTALVKDIQTTYSNHVTGGIIAVKALFRMLEAEKQHNVAVSLAEQTTLPSWGYMLTNTIEPAKTSLWELWRAPSTGPGCMNSRNHHMFSSISEWIVRHVGGMETNLPSCDRSQVLTYAPAKTLAVSHAALSIDAPCGEVSVSFARHGGTQCVRHPETKSSVAPFAVEAAPAVVDCGARGGVITGIEFASFGHATGTCGGELQADASCHAPASVAVVESLCVGKQSCSIPTSADFWMANGGAGASCGLDGAARTLAVQAVCSAPHSLDASVRVPVGTTMDVRLPTFGMDLQAVKVTETVSQAVVFGAADAVVLPTGVLRAVGGGSAVTVSVQSGAFEFVLQ